MAGTDADAPVSPVDTPCVPPAPASCTVDLPGDILAHVLNFMKYGDVRVTFRAGRRFAIDAARKVETLNVTEASELIVAPRDKPLSQRRFPNVKEINCMSLVKDGGENFDRRHSLCPRTLLRIIPFLVSFPRLEKAFVGGGYDRNGEKLQYSTDYCIELHNNLFRILVEQFCVEFKSGGLPPKLLLRGILPESMDDSRFYCQDFHEEEGDYKDETKACSLCSSICAHFPPHAVIGTFSCCFFPHHQTSLCISDAERIRRVGRRLGFPFQAETAVIADFLESLPNIIRKYEVVVPSQSDAIFELARQLKEEEQPYALRSDRILDVSKDHNFIFHYVSEEGLDKLKKIPRAHRGNDDICRLAMNDAVSNHLKYSYGLRDAVWDETSLKRLASLGFRLHCLTLTMLYHDELIPIVAVD